MNVSTINNLRQLANFLRCDTTFLKAYLDGSYQILDRKYSFDLSMITDSTSIIEKLYLRKKNKLANSHREVYAVRTDTLKDILKGLSTFLKELHQPSIAVHGYVQGRNIRTNAEAHLSKKYLLSVDISNFFESITIKMVEQTLSSIGFSSFAAIHLSKVVTIQNFLPPGFNTSPIISNIVTKDMDEQLTNLCGEDSVYTRYADDIYFSSDIALPNLEDINAIVIKNGFALNPNKTKIMPRGGKQYVTGLTVFDHERPRITKRIKKNFRLELYYLVTYGLQNHALKKMGYTKTEYKADINIRLEVDTEVKRIHNRITGWLKFMYSVERPAAQKFIEQYKKVSL